MTTMNVACAFSHFDAHSFRKWKGWIEINGYGAGGPQGRVAVVGSSSYYLNLP